eukprot:TRINITY_DN5929_c0_g4_i5.p1 TRINITY_DN5929_c0_g4~~TRINITY_DN5929_c0_g4_i5.p1  ORF type:complete len:346 (+),score=-15.12 TRINITY_DN5929_c0_g4_i5:28-1038(+)
MNGLWRVAVACVLVHCVSGIQLQTPLPTPVATPMPTPLPTPLPTPMPTPLPTPVPTPMPTPLPTPLPTPMPTPLPTPVPTPMPTPLPTPDPTPMPTPFPTDQHPRYISDKTVAVSHSPQLNAVLDVKCPDGFEMSIIKQNGNIGENWIDSDGTWLMAMCYKYATVTYGGYNPDMVQWMYVRGERPTCPLGYKQAGGSINKATDPYGNKGDDIYLCVKYVPFSYTSFYSSCTVGTTYEQNDLTRFDNTNLNPYGTYGTYEYCDPSGMVEPPTAVPTPQLGGLQYGVRARRKFHLQNPVGNPQNGLRMDYAQLKRPCPTVPLKKKNSHPLYPLGGKST